MTSSLNAGKTASRAISPKTAYTPWLPIAVVIEWLRLATSIGPTLPAAGGEGRSERRRPERVLRGDDEPVGAAERQGAAGQAAVPGHALRAGDLLRFGQRTQQDPGLRLDLRRNHGGAYEPVGRAE